MELKKKTKNWENEKFAIWISFALGLLTHIYCLTNAFPNHDGLGSMYFDQNMITSGRNFLTYACGISSYYNLPWVDGLLSIAYISICSGMIIRLLEITTKQSVILISGLIVTFPAVFETFCFIYTADGYFLAMLLAVLAVYCVEKQGWRQVCLGSICLGLSLGIYQIYVSIALILAVIKIVLKIFDEENISTIKSKVLSYFFMFLGGAIAYTVSLLVMLKIQGKKLSSYNGINETFNFSLDKMWNAFLFCYKDFWKFITHRSLLTINNLQMGARTKNWTP